MNQVKNLIEPATDLLVDYIQTNIGTALAAVRTERNSTVDLGIPTPVFQQYFIYRNYSAFPAPALFVVCDDMDFHKERGANFICSVARYTFAAISEGQTTEIVARANWRYQTALCRLLDNLSLTSTDGSLKIVVVVKNADFSEEYDVSQQAGNAAKRWRKECHLRCDVNIFEELGTP